MIFHFLASFLIWFFLWLPVWVVSIPAVAIMLLTDWSGGATWFGNYKYPRGYGNGHFPENGGYWDSWWFLVIRNPVSNFGKKVLSVSTASSWPWHYNLHITGRWYCKFGWKPSKNMDRTFVFRPLWKD